MVICSNQIIKDLIVTRAILFILLSVIHLCGIGQPLPKNYGKITAKLFVSVTKAEMLVVAFGGSEGGDTFSSEKTKDVRDRFSQLGFAFLSVGYFGANGLPKKLDRISLTAIHDSILNISSRLHIKPDRILLVGASRGAELALNLASRYECMGVIALVAPSVSFPNSDAGGSTSSWTFNDKEIPYLQLSHDLIKKNGWYKEIEKELKNEEKSEYALIKVENINGFVFLTSAKKDELWPSEKMCNEIVTRLKASHFRFKYNHISLDGGHQPSKHWDVAFKFIEENIRSWREE